VEAAKQSGHTDKDIKLRLHPDYDHSYYFISTFAEDHVEHAARYLLS
jgi:S-formylglutathione hydrolase